MNRLFRLAISLGLVMAATIQAQDPDEASRIIEGRLDIVWGDGRPGFDEQNHLVITVTEDDGSVTELAMSESLFAAHGGFLQWNHGRVRVRLRQDEVPFGVRMATADREDARPVAALTLLERSSTRGGLVSGSQPWVSILCKFSDKPAEPENLAFFQNMYANAPGRLDHYWREQSYDLIDVVGSTAFDWVDLPQPQTFYAPTPGSNFNSNLGALFNDCTDAADSVVDFSNGGSPYVGINQMFNDVLDCCAWGGSQFATLDGVTKSWRVTWNPPWAFANEGVIGHEMGHGFGLPHSNNFDGDSSPYDSPWDVMSSATGYSVVDATYGRLGMHTISYHKNRLGWIPASEKLVVGPGSSATVTVDPLALESTTNYRLIEVPIDGSSRYYTVEVRDRIGNYDGALPGTAVILHEIDPGRSEPAWAVDADVPPANYGDNEGTMFRVGEVFLDPASGIVISVLAETTDGFLVSVNSGDTSLIFGDGYESGDLSAWSSSSP